MDDVEDAAFCAGMDEKVGPQHCGCVKGRGETRREARAERVRELLDALLEALEEMRGGDALPKALEEMRDCEG